MASNNDDNKPRVGHISELTPDSHNPRSHNPRNIGMIVDSLHEVGSGRSIVIDENGRILAGNGTIEAAAQAGIEKLQIVDVEGDTIVAVRRSGLTPRQKERLALFDNRTAELATWEEPVLADMQQDGLLEGLFYDEELDTLLHSLTDAPEPPPEGLGGDDFLGEPDEGQSRVKAGDIWLVGPHKILCADCRHTNTVSLLMDNRKAQGIITSPPYAELRATHYDSIPEENYLEWWASVQAAMKEMLSPDGSLFLNIKAHTIAGERVLYVMDLVLTMRRRWNWKFVDELCWTHITAPGAWPDRFKNGWEPVYHFAKGQVKFRPKNVQYEGFVPDTTSPKQNNAGTGFYYNVRSHNIMGLAYPNNVIDTGRSDRGIDHPAIFPVALPTFFMLAYSDPRDLWVDPFLGSGTSIVSAHRTNRICYGIDNSPPYCDLAIRRAEAEGITPIGRLYP